MAQYVLLDGTSGEHVDSADHADWDIAGSDFDFRFKGSNDDWTPGGNRRFAAKNISTDGYAFGIDLDGKIQHVSINASTTETNISSLAVPFSDSDVAWSRIKLVTTTLTYYTSTDTTQDPTAVSWTQLGTTDTITQDPVNTASSFFIGRAGHADANQWAGRVYVVWLDIGGSVKGHFDGNDFTIGEGDGDTAVGAAGKTWTLRGTNTVIEDDASGSMFDRNLFGCGHVLYT